MPGLGRAREAAAGLPIDALPPWATPTADGFVATIPPAPGQSAAGLVLVAASAVLLVAATQVSFDGRTAAMAAFGAAGAALGAWMAVDSLASSTLDVAGGVLVHTRRSPLGRPRTTRFALAEVEVEAFVDDNHRGGTTAALHLHRRGDAQVTAAIPLPGAWQGPTERAAARAHAHALVDALVAAGATRVGASTTNPLA